MDIWRMTKQDGTTLSTATRHLFHTDSIVGKTLFLAALAVLAVHILNK